MKKIYTLTLVFIISVLATGCDKTKDEDILDFYCNSDYVYVDYTHQLLNFELLLLTKEDIKEIKVTKVSGENVTIDDFDIKVINNSIDVIKKCIYRDLKPSVWNFEMYPKEQIESATIDKMTLLINGEEREIQLKNPLKYIKGEGTKFAGNMEPGVIPIEFSNALINGELKPTFAFKMLDDVELLNVNASGDIKIDISSVRVNEKEEISTDYPISFKQNDSAEIMLGFSSVKLSKYNSITADVNFEYKSVEVADYLKSVIVVSAVYPITGDDLTDLKEYIDVIIGKE